MEYDKVLVTGGAGFIGSHTVEALLDLDARTWVLDDLSSGTLRNLSGLIHDPRLHFVRGSIMNFQRVRSLASKVDAIIHLAAQISPFVSMRFPEATTLTNVNGTLNILRAAAKEHVQKVVFASSSSVYGDVKSRYVSEETAHQSYYAIRSVQISCRKILWSILPRIWRSHRIAEVLQRLRRTTEFKPVQWSHSNLCSNIN